MRRSPVSVNLNVIPQIFQIVEEKSPCKSDSREVQDKAQQEEESHRELKLRLCHRQHHLL